MQTVTITSCGTTIVIESNIDLYESIKSQIPYADFPELEIQKGRAEDCEYLVKYANSNYIELTYREREVLFRCPFEKTENGMVILYVTYPLLEKKRRNNKALTFHGAAVGINNNGILLLGKEGAGKTTLALQLCEKHHAELIGNDLCVLDYQDVNNLYLLGGTKFIHLRYESIKRNIPGFLFYFDGVGTKDNWTCKKKVMPEDLGINTIHSPIKVSKIYIVHIDQNYSFYHTSAYNINNVLYLNENFSRYIKNSCTALIVDKKIIGYIPSLDTYEDFKNRSILINAMFQSKIEYISGNLNEVAEYIYNNI